MFYIQQNVSMPWDTLIVKKFQAINIQQETILQLEEL
jgi:hypothetical protein